MDDARLRRQLEEFGLSEKEVDTYLTILEFGSGTASEVADAAGVSKRYVYNVSDELAERGFVTVEDHVVPTRIEATPPAELVSRLRDDLADVGAALETRYTAAEPTDDQFEVIKTRATVLNRLREQVESASSEVFCAVPVSRFDAVADTLAAAVDRGVFVGVVLSGAGDTAPEFAGRATVGRRWMEPMPLLVTVDQRAGMVAPRELLTRSNSDQQAIAFTQPQLAPIIVGSFLGNYWPNAEEVYVTDPAELPREFTSFRHAVTQAVLHRRSDGTLYAELKGRPVGADGDDLRRLSGAVVAVRQGLVEPATNDFPVESALVVETADGRYSVGGPDAFVEDIEVPTSATVRLSR
ncbi:MAG: TrmB family transcriptional regulator [Halobaculum sp.]